MTVDFIMELLRAKRKDKDRDSRKWLVRGDSIRAAVAAGGAEALEELEKDLRFHLAAIKRVELEEAKKRAVREERKRLRFEVKQCRKVSSPTEKIA